MLPCGELDLGTEQNPDLILTWISSMIWFTWGVREGERGCGEGRAAFLSWQNLILLPKLLVELQCDCRCSQLPLPLPPSLPLGACPVILHVASGAFSPWVKMSLCKLIH